MATQTTPNIAPNLADLHAWLSASRLSIRDAHTRCIAERSPIAGDIGIREELAVRLRTVETGILRVLESLNGIRECKLPFADCVLREGRAWVYQSRLDRSFTVAFRDGSEIQVRNAAHGIFIVIAEGDPEDACFLAENCRDLGGAEKIHENGWQWSFPDGSVVDIEAEEFGNDLEEFEARIRARQEAEEHASKMKFAQIVRDEKAASAARKEAQKS